MPRLLPSVALALLMAGCTQFPEIDARVPEAERNAPPPRLIPLAPLLARADAATLQSRVAPYVVEVDKFGAVIAQDTRARMDAGVTLPAALQ